MPGLTVIIITAVIYGMLGRYQVLTFEDIVLFEDIHQWVYGPGALLFFTSDTQIQEVT